MPSDRRARLERYRLKGHRLEGHVALVLVQVFFGLFPLAVKWTLESFTSTRLVAWRIAVGGVVLFVLAVLRHGRRVWPGWRVVPRLVLCGVFGVLLNQVLAVSGIERSTSVDAGILMTLIPVFTFGVAVLAKQETFHPRRALGIGVALTGVLLLHGDALVQLDFGRHLAGNLMIVANCASYALYLVLARSLLAHQPPLVLIAWAYLSVAWALPFLGADEPWVPEVVTPRAWLGLAFILVFPTILAYVLNTFALARVRASTTAVYIYLQPLIAGTAGVLLLEEDLPPTAVAAAILLFVGIWLVARVPERPIAAAGAGVRPEPAE